MGTVLPISSYPSALDTNTTLFQVYNTSETVLSQTLLAWETTINIIPVPAGKPELWADTGYVTIEGELIYYAAVTRVSAAVTQFKSCIRRVNGVPSKNNPVGTSVRGFVIAEHHNNLARALVNVEEFIGITNTTDKNSILWKLNYINSLLPYTDDAGCPQLEFYYTIVTEDPIQGTEISYNLTINSTVPYTGFTIDFGDGTTENESLSGTHFYPPNKKVEPVVTVNSPACDALQTSAQKVSLDDLQQVNIVGLDTFPIVVPAIPDFPNFSLATVNDVPDAIQFPPIVFPCLDIGPFGPISIPSTISLINPNVIPSVITFQDIPVFPSIIKITSDFEIPSVISIIDNIPTTITVIDDLPSIIDVNSNLPSVISIISPSNISISLIAPSVINLAPTVIQVQSNIPSVISVNDIDISVSLTSDYCTNCTGSIQASAPNTAGGPTDVGCNVCAGANQKITKVTVVLHDFLVQTFNAQDPSTRYDLVKVLVVDPSGNTCLLMGGNIAGNTSTPQFIMTEPVTLTFDDSSTNDIYDFSVPLKTGTYYPNANGNTGSRNAGTLVNLSAPAPAPSGFNGYGSNLAVFTDQPLVKGAWNVYIGVGPNDATYTNLCYVGSACARVNSNGEAPCDFPTPTPSPCGATPKPSKTPAPTPRRTNAPTATPKNTGTPLPTPNKTPIPTPAPSGFGPGGQPWPGTGGGGGGGGGTIIPVDPGRPIPVTPKPSKTPKPTPAPTPLPNCGSCDFTPSIEDCGSGVCTYYWNFTSQSWSRCAECQSCTTAGENCGCPEARWMVSYGKLPADGSNNATVNTNCQKFVWTNNNLTQCSGGFCTYFYTPGLGQWSYAPDDSYCESGSGCSCPDPSILVAKGVLPKSSQNNITRHTKCYQETAISKCNQGCECPDPPTVQTITSTSQIISKSCEPECGTCIDEYITDLNNPCDPDPTDQTCIYEYTGTFGWRLDPASFCGCDNMNCLSVQAAKDASLLPDSPNDGETFNLSCYGGAWYNYDFCNPEADCKCPPAPTPPPAGQQPGNSFLVNQCINPTPTPSPTVGCGDCIFEFDAPVCGSGTCVYTYYSDLEQWTVGPNCGSSTCNCMNVEDAIFMGLLPENPGDGEQVNTSCYFYNSNQQKLEGTWDYTGNTCTSDCTCLNTASYSGFGYFPGQIKIENCEPKPSPTPTPSASGPQPSPLPTPAVTTACSASSCIYYWAGTGCSTGSVSKNCYYQFDTLTNQWQFVTGQCTGGCTCPSVAQLQTTIGQLAPGTLDFYTGCVNPDPTAGSWVLFDNYCGPNCSCPQVYDGSLADYGYKRYVSCQNGCAACLYKWNGTQYVVVVGNCGFPCLPSGCKSPPTTYSTDTISLPCGYEACSGGCAFTCTQSGGSYTWVPTGLCLTGGECACYPLSAGYTCTSANVGLVVNSSCSLPNNGCIGNCYFTWDAAAKTWIYDSGSSQACIKYGSSLMLYNTDNDMDFSSYESEETFSPQALSCGCVPPFYDGTTNGLKALGTCGPVANPINLTFVEPIYVHNAEPVSLIANITPTATPYVEHTPAPTPPPSITPIYSDILTTSENLKTTLAPISKERVKLCQYADKEPARMVKQGCGTCAIRKCEKFGLCSHTSIIEGHPEVICCQNCTSYSPNKTGNINLPNNKNNPLSSSVVSDLNTQNSQVGKISADSPVMREVQPIQDAMTMAENEISANNKIKVVPADSVIHISVDELIDGKKEANER